MQVGDPAPYWAPGPDTLVRLRRFSHTGRDFETPDPPIEFVVFHASVIGSVSAVRLIGKLRADYEARTVGVGAIFVESPEDFEIMQNDFKRPRTQLKVGDRFNDRGCPVIYKVVGFNEAGDIEAEVIGEMTVDELGFSLDDEDRNPMDLEVGERVVFSDFDKVYGARLILFTGELA